MKMYFEGIFWNGAFMLLNLEPSHMLSPSCPAQGKAVQTAETELMQTSSPTDKERKEALKETENEAALVAPVCSPRTHESLRSAWATG